MNLDSDKLDHLRYCAALAIQLHRGRQPPDWLPDLFRELDTEVKLSASGQQRFLDAAESDTISSVEAAVRVSKSERWVRRHPELLGGQKHGDRWRFSRVAIEKYVSERGSE